MTGLRVAALVVLSGLVLTACIDKGGAENAAGGEPSAPVIEQAGAANQTDVSEDAAVATPAEPGARAGATDAGGAVDSDADAAEQPDYTAIALSGLTNKPLLDASIQGSWVSLFGKQNVGVIEHAWEEGHQVDFLPDGQAIWSRLVNGVVVETMDSQWSHVQERLDLSFSAGDALSSGMASVAPLGLQPGDMESPGMTDTPGDNSFNPMESAVMVTLYPSFLVLTDRYGKLMVYGRLSESEPAVGAQGLAGYWTASLREKPDGIVRVGFSDGDMELSHWIEGSYTGRFIKGYFVGRLRGDGTESYAVAAHNELTGGHIHGIICEGPYYQTHAPFEFIR